ncbi:MAG: hypothetical protein ACAI25_14160, partial [Planctomycetota bacterium]
MRLPIATYGRFDCALQSGPLFALGAIVVLGANALARPELGWLGLIPVGLGLFIMSFYRDF